MQRFLLLLLVTWAAACSGGGGPGNAAPRVIPVLPGVDLTAEEGVEVLVQWLDNDPDDIATTDVFADVDGDLSTTNDQIVLASGVTELNGVQQEVVWDTNGFPFAVYRIIYRIDDDVNPPVIVFAPGRVNLVPNPPPTAEVLFPPPTSVTEATAITVTGRSEDVTGTRFVRVNGVTANTTDKFKTWQVVVDLLPNELNVITVETQDELNNRDPSAATIFVDTRAGQPAGAGTAFGPLACAAFDFENLRVIALEAPAANRLLGVDWMTGDRTELAGTGPAIQGPACVRYDAVGERAFVADAGARAVLQVSGVTGERVIVSDDGRGTGAAFVEPRALGYDENQNDLIVLDAGLGAVLRVDIPTGDRTVLSSAAVGAGPTFDDPRGLAVDVLRRVAYVTDAGLGAVICVDFVGGTRTVVSALGTGMGTTFLEPGGLAVDIARNRVVVADAGRAAIIGVNLFSGDRTVVSGPADARGTLLVDPVDVVVDTVDGRMFVTDSGLGAIFALELVRADRVVLSR